MGIEPLLYGNKIWCSDDYSDSSSWLYQLVTEVVLHKVCYSVGFQLVTKITVMWHNKWPVIMQFIFMVIYCHVRFRLYTWNRKKNIWKQNLVFGWLFRQLNMNLPTGYRRCIEQSLVFRWLQKVNVMRHNEMTCFSAVCIFWLLPIQFNGHKVFFEYQKFVWNQILVFRGLLRHLIMNLPTGYRSCIAQSLVFRWLQCDIMNDMV